MKVPVVRYQVTHAWRYARSDIGREIVSLGRWLYKHFVPTGLKPNSYLFCELEKHDRWLTVGLEFPRA
jgi:hypothetical protein